jgi:hypothetical protein
VLLKLYSKLCAVTCFMKYFYSVKNILILSVAVLSVACGSFFFLRPARLYFCSTKYIVTYCTMLGSLITSDHQLYNVSPLKTPFRLLIGLLQSQSHVTTFTHNYFLCSATFTQLTIIHVRDYNHLLHSYTG